jgi:hypothetical protein
MQTLSDSRDMPRRLGALPTPPGTAFSRSLWVLSVGEGWMWPHAVLPIDDRLDMPDQDHITRLCEIVGMSLRHPMCRADEEAFVVLRRPGPAAISEADAHIFRLVCEAVADRASAPWTFYVAGPEGARECFRQQSRLATR